MTADAFAQERPSLRASQDLRGGGAFPAKQEELQLRFSAESRLETVSLFPPPAAWRRPLKAAELSAGRPELRRESSSVCLRRLPSSPLLRPIITPARPLRTPARPPLASRCSLASLSLLPVGSHGAEVAPAPVSSRRVLTVAGSRLGTLLLPPSSPGSRHRARRWHLSRLSSNNTSAFC